MVGLRTPFAPAGLGQPQGLQYKPLSPGRGVLAGGLQGLGQYLLALGTGQPQNAMQAFQGGLQGFEEGQYRRQQQADYQEDREYRRTRQQQEDADRAEKKAKAAEAEAKWGAFQTRLTDDDPTNDPTGIRDILPYLPPEMQMQMAPDLFAEPKAPTVSGGMTWNAQTKAFEPIPGWLEQQRAIAEAGRAPREEKIPGITTLYGKDGKPVSLRDNDPKIDELLGQGFVETAPKSGSVLAVVGEDPQGNPIYDYVSTDGPKPPNATAASANIRGLLIEQGLEDLANVDFGKVSATKIAAADMANSKGALGELAGNMLLNDDEKRLLGAQGAIQEAIISAITGAAYSEDQKRNMRSKYVVQPSDSPTRRAEKTKASAEFLAQLDRNSGNTRISTGKNETPDDDGYTIEEVK